MTTAPVKPAPRRRIPPARERESALVLPCPFCGGNPIIQPWHGGGPGKRDIACVHDWCDVQPSVTGPSILTAANRWNTRGGSPGSQSEMRDLAARIFTFDNNNPRRKFFARKKAR